jgi:hypothetical protein
MVSLIILNDVELRKVFKKLINYIPFTRCKGFIGMLITSEPNNFQQKTRGVGDRQLREK